MIRTTLRSLTAATLLAASLAANLLAASSAHAQLAPAADPERLAAARELFVAMGSDKQMDVALDTMLQGMTKVFKQQKPGAAKEIDDVMGRLTERFKARKSEVTDINAPLYAAQFTKSELDELTKFYKSPIGTKMVSKLPTIMQQSMQSGMAWGQKIGQEIAIEARDELKKRGVDL